MEKAHGDVTILLSEVAKGNQKAASDLFPLVYEELRRLAQAYMSHQRPGHTLQATALVNEAYLKLVKQRSVDWRSRAHFFRFAAKTMRRILIDYARARHRVKRPGTYDIIPLEKAIVFSPEKSAELLRLDEALEQLSELDRRQGEIVEMRFYGGLSVEETAFLLGTSPTTVKREWSSAKAWLYGQLRKSHEDFAGELANR